MNQEVGWLVVVHSELHQGVVGPRIAAVHQLEASFGDERDGKRRRTVNGPTSFDRLEAEGFANLVQDRRIQRLSLLVRVRRRRERQEVLVADLHQVGENGLELIVVERQIGGYSVRGEDVKLLDWLADETEGSASLLDQTDETHVVVGVEVGHVDGVQVAEDAERHLAAELSVDLK